MQPQEISPGFSESLRRTDNPLMDGERPTIIQGLKPAPCLRTDQSSTIIKTDKPTICQRLIAGLWFAAAAAVPGLLVLAWLGGFSANRSEDWEFLTTILFMPAVVAGICGAWVGASILSDTTVDAFYTGAKVTFLSMIGIAAVVATAIVLTGHSDDNPFVLWCEVFLAMVFYAVIFTGWLLIPFGGLAGCMLQGCSWLARSRAAHRNAARHKPTPSDFAKDQTLSFPAACRPVSPENSGSLMNCPGCQRIVSRCAANCPRCGHKI